MRLAVVLSLVIASGCVGQCNHSCLPCCAPQRPVCCNEPQPTCCPTTVQPSGVLSCPGETPPAASVDSAAAQYPSATEFSEDPSDATTQSDVPAVEPWQNIIPAPLGPPAPPEPDSPEDHAIPEVGAGRAVVPQAPATSPFAPVWRQRTTPAEEHPQSTILLPAPRTNI